jgi:hypothetical protein
MDITILDVKNAMDLDGFTPVEGNWFIEADEDLPQYGYSLVDIEDSVRNYMDADFEIDVQIFTLDGRQINGDTPFHGSFLATRAYPARGMNLNPAE